MPRMRSTSFLEDGCRVITRGMSYDNIPAAPDLSPPKRPEFIPAIVKVTLPAYAQHVRLDPRDEDQPSAHVMDKGAKSINTTIIITRPLLSRFASGERIAYFRAEVTNASIEIGERIAGLSW